MQDWLAGEAGGQYLTAILWTVGALVLLAIALLIARMLRRGTTAFGGHGRDHKPRLTVGESIEIDNQRRLILVRRDDVEHLILTGGPSDVVVEQGIGRSPAPVRREFVEPVFGDHRPRRPAAVVAPSKPAEEIRAPAAKPEPALDTPVRPAPEPEAAPVMPAAVQPAGQHEEKRPEPTAPPPRQAASPVDAATRPVDNAPQQRQAGRGPEEDEIVEFPQSDITRLRRQAEGQRDSSLEDEMSRLLEDISDERR